MNSAFIEDNKGKYYFNLAEILRQSSPRYDHKRFKEYNDPISPMYIKAIKDKKEKNKAQNYMKDLKNHCHNETKKVKEILKCMGLDLEKEFKTKNGGYKIPIFIAELIYVISSEDAGKNSTISKLKNNKNASLTFEECQDLYLKTLNEIEKDYCEAKSGRLYNSICDARKRVESECAIKSYALISELENKLAAIKDRLLRLNFPFDYDPVTPEALCLMQEGETFASKSNTDRLLYDLEAFQPDSLFYYENNVIAFEKVEEAINNLEEELYLLLKTS